jgi:hypothetical protein
MGIIMYTPDGYGISAGVDELISALEQGRAEQTKRQESGHNATTVASDVRKG